MDTDVVNSLQEIERQLDEIIDLLKVLVSQNKKEN